MLQDKLKDLQKAVEAKREDVKAKKATADGKRKELAESDLDLTKVDDEAVQKAITEADEAYKPYSKAAEELVTLEGQFERIAMMAADGGQGHGGLKTENEIDRHAQEARESLGQKAVESEAYQNLVKSGALAQGSEISFGAVQITEPMDRAEFKSLLTGRTDAAGGVLNVPERFPGLYDLPRLPLGILDLVTVGETDANAVEFVRLLARTIAAVEVAEAETAADIGSGDPAVTAAQAGQKPESGLTFEEVLEGVKTIAHWIPATRNQLADAAFLRTLVESELLQGVERRAESQIINGSGVGVNLRGILATPGIASVTQGTTPSAAADTKADAVHRLFTVLRLAGYEPSGLAIHPQDWEDIRLSKDDNLNYIWGPPSLAGQMQIWGVPALSTIAVAADNPVAGEWARALFLVREAARVLISDSHKDWFTRNLVALLAEARGVLVVPRPQAFGEVNFTP